ncbi:hypothetical protein [Streptomyces sp. NPDC059378]|uniref:hypothetical protein n=1 Tax=Streptomyces sp. NPDC059378 TaxID=3346815 RepID=UPI0036B63E1C
MDHADTDPDANTNPAANPAPAPDKDPAPDAARRQSAAPHPYAEAARTPAPDADPGKAANPAPEADAAPDAEAAPDPAPDADPDTPTPETPDSDSARGRPRRLARRARRVALGLVLALLLPLLAAETALRVNYAGDPADGTYTRGRDAIWLGHAWVDGRKRDVDITALAHRLDGSGIRDLYVHAGPLEHDGTLPKSAYKQAGWLTSAVHRELPGVRVQAWLGDKLATEEPDGMHLERTATRAAVVRSTREVLAAGFDGVHFDLEPLHSGDGHYLALLDSLHKVTAAAGVPLSVASHQIDPLPGFHSFWGTVAGHPKWWSQEFFGQVARRVDQIAVMSYDTMQPLPSTYGGYVAQQTALALEVTPPSTDLLMGLPFFHENRFGHWAHAETVPAAVRGVRLGLSRTDADRAAFGVALYVDFAATEDDWTAYRKGWVNPR